MNVSDTHYLELLDIALNECRKKFDSGNVDEMEKALYDAKRFNVHGYRDQEVSLMEQEFKDSNREWWQNYQERQRQYQPARLW